MSHPPLIRVLSICDDDMVRSTRELLLRKDGYEIVSIASDDLLSIPDIRAMDVAVICHSVPAERAMEIADRLRRYKPEIRLLKVNPRVRRIDTLYDVDLEVLAGPGALLEAVKELLDKNASGHSACQGRDEYCGPFPEFPLSHSGTLQPM